MRVRKPFRLIRWDSANANSIEIWIGERHSILLGNSSPSWVVCGETVTTISFNHDINIEDDNDILYLSKKP